MGVHPAGDYNVTVLEKSKGLSNALPYTYELVANNPDVNECGYGGGRNIVISGSGFSMSTLVTVCDSPCKILNVTDGKTLECATSVLPDYETKSGDVACAVVVREGGKSVTLANAFTYKESLTSYINGVSPQRFGTGGGKRLTITGTSFVANPAVTKVTIAGIECDVKSVTSTEVVCITKPSKKTAMGVEVIVSFDGAGNAIPKNATVDYVDVWSSPFTWGGGPLPTTGK